MPERNLLLLAEPTPSGNVAIDVACRIAAMGKCCLTGLEISERDKPKRKKSQEAEIRHHLIQTLRSRQQESNPNLSDEDLLSAARTRYLHKAVFGPKYATMAEEAECNDLIILGRDGNFEDQSGMAKEVISLMLQYRPRPMVITPSLPPENDSIMVAYNGSARASRALQFLVLLGLVKDRRLQIVTIDRNSKVAETKLEPIKAFLARHEVEADSTVIESKANPTEVLFDNIEQAKPGLVVAGAQGKNWRESMFGSASSYLIRHCRAPLFTSS